jgi:hypothetical protein
MMAMMASPGKPLMDRSQGCHHNTNIDMSRLSRSAESFDREGRQGRDLAIGNGYCCGCAQQPGFLRHRVSFQKSHLHYCSTLTDGSNSDVTGDNKDPTGPPASGKIPISTLGQAVVNIGVDPVTGLLSKQDYFMPVGYAKLNTGDKDFSSSGVTLLDPNTFSAGSVTRVAVAGSKVGTIYVMDANNLGGYKNGALNRFQLRQCTIC